MREITLNKQQFSIFNNNDQFQLFTDEDGFPDFEDFQQEVDKLFTRYDSIIIREDDSILGSKEGKREVLADWSDESFMIAVEVMEDEE